MSEKIEPRDARQRRILWIVLILNLAIAIGFFGTGAFGDSSALIANGLDNTSDAFVYALSLFACPNPTDGNASPRPFQGAYSSSSP